MNEEIKALWIAAQVHCATMMGEALDERFQEEGEMPKTADEVIAIVTKYLKESG